MEQWYEVVELAATISFSEEEDALIWQYTPSESFLEEYEVLVGDDRGATATMEDPMSYWIPRSTRAAHQLVDGSSKKAGKNLLVIKNMVEEDDDDAVNLTLEACNLKEDVI
ncbi:hypothetical protein EJB05_46923, partial [Eragrostis curvula]